MKSINDLIKYITSVPTSPEPEIPPLTIALNEDSPWWDVITTESIGRRKKETLLFTSKEGEAAWDKAFEEYCETIKI